MLWTAGPGCYDAVAIARAAGFRVLVMSPYPVMRRLSRHRSEPAKKSGQNIPKNRCRTTIAERIVETLAELPGLVAAEIVPSGGSAPDAYMFRHALIRMRPINRCC